MLNKFYGLTFTLFENYEKLAKDLIKSQHLEHIRIISLGPDRMFPIKSARAQFYSRLGSWYKKGGGADFEFFQLVKPVLVDNMKLDIHNHILPSTWPNLKEVLKPNLVLDFQRN